MEVAIVSMRCVYMYIQMCFVISFSGEVVQACFTWMQVEQSVA